MIRYVIRRCMYVFPTLFVILTFHFFMVQLAPGGPIEHIIARWNTLEPSSIIYFSPTSSEPSSPQHRGIISYYRGGDGLDEITRAQLETQLGFNKPLWKRYLMTIKNYFFFQFGDSFFKGDSVLHLIGERLPVSLSLALWSTLLIYIISIPLGIKKARAPGGWFDVCSNVLMTLGYALPAFLVASLLILFLAGGNYFSVFPLRGLVSADFNQLSMLAKIGDYFWHLALPILAITIGGFSSLTLLSRNAFLEEIQKSYAVTARAKGLSENQILYRHVFRNALVLLIAGFPSLFLPLFFGGTVLIEVIFSLPGLGSLGYEAILNRDYPIIFGTVYIFTFIGLFISILSDIMLSFIDPRIHFEVS